MENNNNTGKTADVASARNRINRLFAERGDRKLLSIYFCAGCPTLEGTADVILTLQRRGIDMIEVGIPFSDPLADGPVIQSAGTTALRNGITLQHIPAAQGHKANGQHSSCADGISERHHALWH